MKKQNPKEEKRLYITYDEYSDGGEAIDPDNRWSSMTDKNIEVKFKTLSKDIPVNRFFYTSIEVDEKIQQFDKLFLCVVRYSTGNTFGRVNGAWYILGVAPTYKIAHLMLQEAIKPSEKGSYSYKPWEGYFERFQDTEIHELFVI